MMKNPHKHNFEIIAEDKDYDAGKVYHYDLLCRECGVIIRRYPKVEDGV